MSPVRKGATPQTQSANVSPPVVKRTTNHQNSLVSAKNMPTVFKKGKIIYFYEKTEGKTIHLLIHAWTSQNPTFLGAGDYILGKLRSTFMCN